MNITTVHERSISVERNITDATRDRRARRAVVEATASQAGRLDGTRGKVLKPAHERKLGAAAMLLWRWLLDQRGTDASARPVVLKAAADQLRLGYRRTKRALERLRVAGLVLTNAYRVPSWIDGNPSGRTGTAPQYLTTLLVTTFGDVTVKRRSADVIVRVPHHVIAWCEAAPGRGGNRRGGRVQTVPEVPASPTSVRAVPVQTVPPISLSFSPSPSVSSLRSETDRRCAPESFPGGTRTSSIAPSIATVPPRASATADSPTRCARPVHPAPLDPLTLAVRELPADATPHKVRAAIGAALALTMPSFPDPVGAFVAMHRVRGRRGQHVHPAFTALEAAERSTTRTEAPPG